MASDGNPWVVGVNCTMSIRHALQNAGLARGFYLKPDTWRMMLPRAHYIGVNTVPVAPTNPMPAGKRVLEGVVVCRDGLLHPDGSASLVTGSAIYTALMGYVDNAGSTFYVRDPNNIEWTCALEEAEARLSTGGSWHFKAWEVRLVFCEI